MKLKTILLSLNILLSVMLFPEDNDNSLWEYLGQKPPGLIPEIFARGVISGKGPLHCFPSFSDDGKVIVWMTLPPKLHYVNFNSKWNDPRELKITGAQRNMFPVFSSDGNGLYFVSADMPGGYGGVDIWYIEKPFSANSRPVNIGLPINTGRNETQPVFTESGTIYYSGYAQEKKWNLGIFRSEYNDGKYSAPKMLDEPINIESRDVIDYTPFISADESFLLFSSNRQNREKEDCRIYVSFRDENDNWSNPVNVNEELEFDLDSRNPYISPDYKYLFLCCGENIYWVSAEIINIIKSESIIKS